MKLDGIRVLDLSGFIPGPMLTLAMADHGADVTKVESPSGDPYREIGDKQDGVSVLFRSYNRGKKSIALNLRDPADLDRFLDMADMADVIVEGSRPGVAKRLGIDYDTIAARNPGIVYVSISAFGQDGPRAQEPAHSLSLEALVGFVSMNLGPDDAPAIPAVPVADVAAALNGLAAVCMALFARSRTGRGDFIDISMQESVVGAMLNVFAPALALETQPVAKHQRTTGGAAFYAIYATSDARHLALAGQEPKFVDALLGALARPDLAPLCARPGPHQAPVFDLLRQTFGRMTLAEATAFLTPLNICWGPAATLPEALDDPQLAARGFILPDANGRRQIGSPIRFRHDPSDPDLAPPPLDGETHN